MSSRSDIDVAPRTTGLLEVLIRAGLILTLALILAVALYPLQQFVARYVEALSLELKAASGGIRERTEREAGVAAKPGERPGAAVGRQVTVVADVIAVDATKQTVRLRGPQRTIDLKVKGSNQFKLVKVGDQVEATFTEAVALSVEPTAKK